MRGVFFLFLLSLSLSVTAQIPAVFKYQAVIRDSSDAAMVNRQVSIRFTIQGTDSVKYCEIHHTTTSPVGMVSLNIGEGEPVSGNVNEIDWLSENHFLQVELAVEGEPFQLMGNEKLLAVPYAMAAATVQNPDEDWIIEGDNMYNIHEGNIGIGTPFPTEKIDVAGNVKISDTLKFRGNYNPGQGIDNPGQILIGEHDILLGYKSNNFGNILIGNSLYGKSVFDLGMTGNGNIGIGTDVFHETTTGYSNLCIGMYTGYNLSTGSNNIFLGSSAGEHIATGNINICIGNQAGNGRQGNSNLFIGDRAGYAWSGGGSDNVMLGKMAGYCYNADNTRNVFVGMYAGYNNLSDENICIGPYTGRSATGNRNIFIGYEAGQNWSGGNTLIIDNHNDNTTPFIKGDMSGDHLEVNASMTVNGEVQQQSVNIQSTLNLQELTEFPLNPTEGDMIYLNDTLRFYNGSVWRNFW